MDLPVLAKANISPVSAGYDVSKVFLVLWSHVS